MLFGAEPRASLAQRDARFLAKKRGLSLSRQAEDGQQAGVSNGTRIAHARQVVVALVDFQSSPGFRSQRREPSRARNNPPENHAGDAVGKKRRAGRRWRRRRQKITLNGEGGQGRRNRQGKRRGGAGRKCGERRRQGEPQERAGGQETSHSTSEFEGGKSTEKTKMREWGPTLNLGLQRES